jgi:integrase
MGNKKLKALVPRYYPARDCWMVDVPASIAGKRKKFFYPTEVEAYQGACKIGLQVSMDAPISNDTSDRKIRGLIPAFLAEKKREVGYDTHRQLVWATNKLVEKFGHLSVDDLNPRMIKQWVATTKLETRGRFNLFACCRTFYNWQEVQEMCPVNPFGQGAPPKQEKGHRAPHLTVEQCKILLDHPFPAFFRAYLVAGLFSGIRPCEVRRISHERALDWDLKRIVIRKEDSKGGHASRPRSIKMRPAFERHMHRGTGLLCDGKTNKQFEPYWKKAAELLGMQAYPKNILRHTAATMLLEITGNAVETAFEMGHTNPTILYSTYANAVTQREALGFWDLI